MSLKPKLRNKKFGKSLRVFVVLAFLIISFYSISKESIRRALLIIDMQPYFVTRNYHHEDPENVAKLKDIYLKQLEVIEHAKKNGIPIIVVEYGGEGDTADILSDAIKDYPYKAIFQKYSDGLFDNKNLADKVKIQLKEWKINSLIAMGANALFCVKCTINGALKNGFNVVAYNSGIAEFNKPKFMHPFYFDKEISDPDGRFIQSDSLDELFTETLPFSVRKEESEELIAVADAEIETRVATPRDNGIELKTSEVKGVKQSLRNRCSSAMQKIWRFINAPKFQTFQFRKN